MTKMKKIRLALEFALSIPVAVYAAIVDALEERRRAERSGR